MMRKEAKNGRHFGIGMASVLMIVVILALTTFSILSLVSAQSDWQTSKRVLALTSDYYEAEKEIQHQLAEIDYALSMGESLFDESESLHLIEKMDGERQLHVVIQKRNQEGDFYDIIRYELENIRDWSPDEKLHIWDGGDN